MRKSATSLVHAGVLLVAATTAAAEPYEKLLEGAQNDAERATRLVKAGMSDKRAVERRIPMLRAAAEYGLKSNHPDGYAAAARAMGALTQLAPDNVLEWMGQRAEALRLWYRTSQDPKQRPKVGERLVRTLIGLGDLHEQGDQWAEAVQVYREANLLASFLEIPEREAALERYRRAVYRLGVFRKAAQLKQTLSDDPANATARAALVRVMVVELDEPAAAVEHLAPDVGEPWVTYVPLAAQPPEKLKPAVCRELGDWYAKALVKDAPLLAKPALLRRAQHYYERFLASYEKKDAIRLKAALELAAVRKELGDEGASALDFSNGARAEGTLMGAADDIFELRVNGEVLLAGHNWRQPHAKEMELRAGDVIAARVRNAGGQQGFFVLFQGKQAGVEFGTETSSWKAYVPGDAEKWWSVNDRAGAAEEGNHNGTREAVSKIVRRPMSGPWRVIWGKGNPCFLYRVVKAADLRPRGEAGPG
jgi:hypothetical protein